MSNRWVTSDLHFGHANILNFNPATRKHSDVDQMNESMIREWNENIQPADEVFIIGDVAFCNAQKAVSILSRLNGTKILVAGNHDRKLLNDNAFVKQFLSIHDYLEISHNKNTVCMFHYPISEWNKCHRGSVHLYGHLHGSKSGLERFRCMDVGVDSETLQKGGQIAILMDEAVSYCLKGDIRAHHYD